MKKTSKLFKNIALLLTVSSLMSCGQNNEEGTSSEFVPSEEKISLEAGLRVLETLNTQEAEKANKVTLTSSNVTNGKETKTEEIFQIGKDYSSLGNGTITTYQNNQIEKSDTYQIRRLVKEDKIIDSSSEATFERYYSIVDYEKENQKKDTASVYYVLNNDSEASTLGLNAYSYILKDDKNVASGAMAIGLFHDTINGQIYSNVSLNTLDSAFFKVSKTATEQKYEYEGTYESISEEDSSEKSVFLYKASFICNKEGTELLSYSYSSELNQFRVGEEDSGYHTIYSFNGSLEYGEREEINSSIVVDDYFLSEVTDIDLFPTGTPSNSTPIEDVTKISAETYYLSARAKTYTPSKAVNLNLTNYSSSKQNVVKLDSKGIFEVLAPGSTILTFLYEGKSAPGVYQRKKFTKRVIIEKPLPDRFVVVESDNYLGDGILYLEDTYSLTVSLYPKTSEQDFTFEVSDTSVLEVNKVSNTLNVKPLKAASKVTITLTSVASPTLKEELTFAVEDDPTEKYKAYLTKTTYQATKYLALSTEMELTKWHYIYSKLTFKVDGTGQREQTIFEEDNVTVNKVVTDTFTYEISRSKITFEFDDASAYLPFTTGLIKESGNRLEIVDDGMKTLLFEVKA